MSRKALIDEWRAANDYYGELEEREAGLADSMKQLPISEEMRPHIDAAKKDPRYSRMFDELPTEFEMVELDKLVLFQVRVTRTYSEIRQRMLGRSPSQADLLKFCLPSESPEASVDCRKMGSKYVFSSDSTDFQSYSAAHLQPEQLLDHATPGTLAGMVGLGVGYGSNYFTGIRYGDRILLHNGYHRAHALRSAGISHAPCIVRTVTRMDELRLAAAEGVDEDTGFYFRAARPPLLKDYFDSKICRSFEVYKKRKVIEISFDIREYSVRI
ncbi:hypothetical protein DEA8626_00768 [Defluviimonas aquaemixtae]|uniref:Uncharacterized protein n=2 Tax=Albidovulum aquaemixtae TaxID=1542388 RepID=A0A2R8B3U1_9RHOB|nr:hypothetical protein DEA8626_00768 [Defluviimonas aquaemixtae]